jgi:adenosylmethionine-8-amino-7-oxononanoate aminotransferase
MRSPALIVEPLVQGAAGMAMHDAHYLRLARAACDRFEVHLIADEIMIGCGRSGTFFAHEQAGVRPDFLCLSKGITGGYLPLSVVLTTDPVYAAFYDDDVTRGFLHSHSYTGNALACRAALATLELFERDDVISSNRTKAAHLSAAAQSIATHPRVRNFRSTGMIWAFEIETEDPAFARHFYQMALEHELLLRPIGNTVYFMPPYVITADEMDILVAHTLEVINALPV